MLTVLNPDNGFEGSSLSFDDPFETVSFVPTVSGAHTIRITRFANRDTYSDLRIGVLVNFYNE